MMYIICYIGKGPRITGLALRPSFAKGDKRAALSEESTALDSANTPQPPKRTAEAWSDRELSTEDTHPHRTQQVSWLTPLKAAPSRFRNGTIAAPTTITVTGSLGILTRFPILLRP